MMGQAVGLVVPCPVLNRLQALQPLMGKSVSQINDSSAFSKGIRPSLVM